MRCGMNKAQFAIIGTEPGDEKHGTGPAFGILYWHDNELDAHRDAKAISGRGGICRVERSPDGVLAEDVVDEVSKLVREVFLGRGG